jgi:hypothetical protein
MMLAQQGKVEEARQHLRQALEAEHDLHPAAAMLARLEQGPAPAPGGASNPSGGPPPVAAAFGRPAGPAE